MQILKKKGKGRIQKLWQLVEKNTRSRLERTVWCICLLMLGCEG